VCQDATEWEAEKFIEEWRQTRSRQHDLEFGLPYPNPSRNPIPNPSRNRNPNRTRLAGL